MSDSHRPYSLSGEAMAIAQAARGESVKLRHRARKLWGMSRAYRALFFDDKGQLRPEARTVLADLCEVAAIARAAAVLDHDYLAELEGRRRVVLHIFGRFNLPLAEMDRLERDIDQMEHPDQ